MTRNRAAFPRALRSALLGLALATAFAGADSLPVEELRPLLGTTWYTVELLNQRIGYAFREVRMTEGPDGKPVLNVTQRIYSQLQLRGLNEPLTVDSTVVSVYDSHLRPLELTMNSIEFGRARAVRAKVQGDQIEVVSEAGGAGATRSIPVPEGFGSDIDLILAILREKASVGSRISFATFDPDLGGCDSHEMWITAEETLPDGRKAYVVHSRSSRLPIEVVSVIGADGSLISFSTPSIMQLKVQMAPEAEALKAAAPLVLSSRIATNVSIADPRRIASLAAQISDATGRPVDYLPQSPRQSVAVNEGVATVSITRGQDPAGDLVLPVQNPEFAPYFEPNDLFQVQDPALVAKALEIVGDETGALAAAEKIVDWVYRSVTKVDSEPRLVSAREVLEQMSGDCTEHAVLCAALCAVVGLPARMVTGIAYARGGFYYHAWNEVYVGEWMEMDAAWGEKRVDAGHIRLEAGRVDMESLARIALAAGRSLGSLSVEITDHQLTAGAADRTAEPQP
jgi:hypothetical protein